MPKTLSTTASASPAEPALSESEMRQMGEQITAQYHRAQIAQVEIIALGAMLMQVEAVEVVGNLPPTAPAQPQGGRYLKGSGLRPWLEKYAPEVEYTKARRYRDIAAALVSELSLKGPEQLQLIAAAAPDIPLDEKLAKKREKLVSLVSDKSVRGLQLELGLVTTAERGAREAPEPKTPAERHETWKKHARANALQCFSSLHILGERWQLLTDAQLAVALEDVSRLQKEIKRWLETPVHERAQIVVEKYLGVADQP